MFNNKFLKFTVIIGENKLDKINKYDIVLITTNESNIVIDWVYKTCDGVMLPHQDLDLPVSI